MNTAPALIPANSITVKSPLRYPGGKSRAVGAVLSCIPEHTDALCAPFVGGGSVELACSARGITVYASDAFEPLVNFWRMAQNHRSALADRVARYHPLSRERFYHLQKSYVTLGDDMERAAAFYVLNRSSFSGTTLSGGMSPGHPRFTQSSIARLRALNRAFNLARMHFDCCDYKTALEKHSETLLYLDPPYANGGRLYGTRGDLHNEFDHTALAALLKTRDRWILSYNDCDLVRELYADYPMTTPAWTYGMSRRKTSSEVLIVNV